MKNYSTLSIGNVSITVKVLPDSLGQKQTVSIHKRNSIPGHVSPPGGEVHLGYGTVTLSQSTGINWWGGGNSQIVARGFLGSSSGR